ncbi:MAG: RNA polymerase sigma factor [Nocardioidaceae bacterium]
MARRHRPQRGTGPGEPALMQAAELARVRAALVLGGVPWDEVDDGVQQVRLKLLEQQAKPHRNRIDNRSGWLAVVASRVAVDWHRSRTKEADLRNRLVQRWSRQHPSHPEEDRLRALVVAKELEQLSPTQRQVLVLRFYQDMTVPEIGRVLGLPVGTVKSRLHAATAAMRTRLVEMEVT